MATSIDLYADNDLVIKVRLKQADPTTGIVSDITTGSVASYISLTNTYSAAPADVALQTSAVYSGSSGIWIVAFDATVLDGALLDGLFSSATPYLIVDRSGGIKAYAPMTYHAARLATIL